MKENHTIADKPMPWDDIWDFQYYRTDTVRRKVYRCVIKEVSGKDLTSKRPRIEEEIENDNL